MIEPSRPLANPVVPGGHPLGPIFIAADDGSGNWHEQAVSNGTIVNFEGGRSGAVATEAILTPTMTLMAVRDADRIRYIKIGSGGDNAIGTKQYQVYTMLTDNSSGWDYARAHAP